MNGRPTPVGVRCDVEECREVILPGTPYLEVEGERICAKCIEFYFREITAEWRRKPH